MSEQANQTQDQSKEAQKTVIAFIAGLLIGGLLVWIFGGSPAETPTDDVMDDNTSEEQSDTTNSNADDSQADDSADTSADDATDDTTNDDTTQTSDDSSDEMVTGEGSVSVSDQPAGTSVTLDSAVFPNDEGWIGVRDYNNGQMGSLLGVVRFSSEQGLVPDEIVLQRATEAGNEYAIVYYTESGDREFSLADDVQIEGVFETFTAQ